MKQPQLYTGRQPIGGGWSIEPPYPMAFREEDGAIVIWHSMRRLTLWTSAYVADRGKTATDTMAMLQAQRSSKAYDPAAEQDGAITRIGYRVPGDGSAKQPSFYGFAIAPEGSYVMLGGFFDDPESLADAQAAWRSLQWAPPTG